MRVLCYFPPPLAMRCPSITSGKFGYCLKPSVINPLDGRTVVSQLLSCLAIASRKITTNVDSAKVCVPGCKHKVQSLRTKTSQAPSKLDSLTPSAWKKPFEQPEPELDWAYLLDKENTDSIEMNIKNRKGVGDIHKLICLSEKYNQEENPEKKKSLRQEMILEGLEIPNRCHPNTIIGDETCAKEIEVVGAKTDFNYKPRQMKVIGGRKGLRMLRDRDVSFATGHRTYFLEADLARLEKALVNFTLDHLKNEGFEFVTVPELLHSKVIESCGFKTDISNSQVYHIHPDCLPDTCLAGTSEMSLAGYFANQVISMDDLPTRLAAVSRCFRAEISGVETASLYRVHHFTKVEMFGLTADEEGSESDELHHYLLDVEKELFSQLGIHYRVMDMPSQELGAPAFKKYDIESWMHGAKIWGEISSCSNCTDYQSRRLNIKYARPDGSLRHVHTVNGTACAVPRMITTLLEQNQTKYQKLSLPPVLQPYMDGQTELTIPKDEGGYRFIKSLQQIPHDDSL